VPSRSAGRVAGLPTLHGRPSIPHFAKPYYKQPRATWYAGFDRRQYTLGPNPLHRPPPVKKNGLWVTPKEILDMFKDLKARRRRSDRTTAPTTGQPVVEVFDEFLDWCRKHKSPRTYAWYRGHIQSFVKPTHDGRRYSTLTVTELRSIHVERWVDAHQTWGPSHQRGTKTAVQRPLVWAVRMYSSDAPRLRFMPRHRALFARVREGRLRAGLDAGGRPSARHGGRVAGIRLQLV
jgi:hypothetical protein